MWTAMATASRTGALASSELRAKLLLDRPRDERDRHGARERNHQCPVCGTGLVTTNGLEQHLATKHPDALDAI
jgi:hypothetical protein